MKIIRWILGALILAWDRTFRPRALERSPEDQARVARETQGWVLYQFEACPFCVKVRRELARLGLTLELRDVKKSEAAHRELLEGGGEIQVPCLRIPRAGGTDQWMYESSEINAFLRSRFGSVNQPY